MNKKFLMAIATLGIATAFWCCSDDANDNNPSNQEELTEITSSDKDEGSSSSKKSSSSRKQSADDEDEDNSTSGDNESNDGSSDEGSVDEGSDDDDPGFVPPKVDLGNLTVTGGELYQTVKPGNAMTAITVSGYQNQPTRQSWNLYFLEGNEANGKFTVSGTVPDHFAQNEGIYTETWIIDGKEFPITLNISTGTSSTKPSSSSVKSSSSTKSSSSVKSSSSTRSSSSAKSSSSVRSSSSAKSSSSSSPITQKGCPAIKYVTGGMSGSGHASRYWDCCKPSCSWPNNANQGSGKVAKQCKFNSTTTETNPNSQSACDAKGSGAMTCINQTAFTVDGCDNIGFAYAATPGNNSCGKCFELTFTGKGKYETKLNHQKLLGKKLIVMATNIGGDVAGGQFDVMIPGGGFGIFNGCDGLNGWKDMNSIERYGGLLSECEKEAGYSGSDATIYEKRKSCLQKKCGEYFFGDAQAKSGCLFLANFMEAAGNPLHTYKEVECPQVLLNGY